jgi:mono/diheme cytochrome c family protein
MTRRRFTFALLLVVALATVAALAVACGDGSASDTSTDTTTPAASTASATAGQPEPNTSNEPAADGPALYAAKCAGCHGADGGGGQGPSLQGVTDMDKVVGQVTDGGASMPAFGSQLSEREIQAIATYVTSGFSAE